MEFQLNRHFQIMYISTFRWNVLFWRNFKENTVHFGFISLGTVSSSHIGSQKLSKTPQLCFYMLRNRVQVSWSHLEVASCSTAYLEEPNFQAWFRRNSLIKNIMIFDQKSSNYKNNSHIKKIPQSHQDRLVWLRAWDIILFNIQTFGFLNVILRQSNFNWIDTFKSRTYQFFDEMCCFEVILKKILYILASYRLIRY